MATLTEVLPPRYQSVRRIAHGGMGEIFLATDSTLGRQVAVKVLAERYARDEPLRARFTREALAAARLSSEPNTVTIFDVGEWNDRPYIVMEHAGGGTVAERLAHGPVDAATALRWLDEAAQALDAAHAQGVVHRDVKPANLLLAGDGSVRVADFGIASAAGLSSLTEAGTILGTAGYLAPEQASGEPAGPAADLYSLAVVAYELLAGARPHEGSGSSTAEALAAAHEPAPPITERRPDLPRALDPVFVRALSHDAARRYRSGAEFVGDLRRAFETADEPTRVVRSTLVPTRRSAPVPRRRSASVRTRRSAWPLALALLLLGLAGGAVAAAIVATGDEEKAPSRQVVRTVTRQGDTVTVTAAAPATTAEPATTQQATAEQTTTEQPTTEQATTSQAQAPPSASGSQLNDDAYRKMQAGDYRGALPLLEQATGALNGSGSTAEAYALYNLAFTRFALGSCDGVTDLLDRSEAIQGHRTEIDSLRKQAAKGCG